MTAQVSESALFDSKEDKQVHQLPLLQPSSRHNTAGFQVAGTPARIDAAFTAIKLRLQANYFDDVGRIEQVHFAGGV